MKLSPIAWTASMSIEDTLAPVSATTGSSEFTTAEKLEPSVNAWMPGKGRNHDY